MQFIADEDMGRIKCPKCGIEVAERNDEGHLVALGEARVSLPPYQAPKIRCSCGLVNVLIGNH